MTFTENAKKIKTIGPGAFVDCNNLKSIKLPKATSIGNFSFRRCINLKNVSLGKGIKNIPEFAFALCTSLNKVNLSKVTSVNRYAFFGCTSLETVTWPSKAFKSKGEGCFERCALDFSKGYPKALKLTNSNVRKYASEQMPKIYGKLNIGKSETMKVGARRKISYILKTKNGTDYIKMINKKPKWLWITRKSQLKLELYSSDKKIAKLDSNKKNIFAVKRGSAKIILTSAIGDVATCNVKVTK